MIQHIVSCFVLFLQPQHVWVLSALGYVTREWNIFGVLQVEQDVPSDCYGRFLSPVAPQLLSGEYFMGESSPKILW